MPNTIGERIKKGNFAFRIKMGDYEVEINGEREEVLKTIRELPNLTANISKAFEASKPKTTTTLKVKTAATKEETSAQKLPRILHAKNCSEAVLNILATDWGKWRPRTIVELEDAVKASGLRYPRRTLTGVLTGLVKKGRVKRWKTDAGHVYILAEEEVLA